jgi:uncharacterized membrane protein
MSTETPELVSKSRLEALSDGVFAVVMTILVLQLGGVAISNAETATELEAALFAQWPTFVSYAISFLVVGVYWVSHHTYFTFIQDVDERQLWLNLLFLFCLSFIPFAADLIGEHPYFRAGAVLYGLDLTACTGALYLNWQYAWNRGHVLVKDADRAVMKLFRSRTRRAAVAYLLATGVAWFSPITGFYLYIAIAAVFAFRQMRSKAMERVLRRT